MMMATFMTLPQELRDRIYEFIALEFSTRHIQTLYTEEVTYPTYRTTTSAITATCHEIHRDYEDVARKATTALELTAVDLKFDDIMTFFDREVDTKFLTILQLNKATVRVNILIENVQVLIQNDNILEFDIKDFYPWALFLIDIKLQVEYHSDLDTWMYLFDKAVRYSLEERCVVEKNARRAIRDNIEDIRRQAAILDEAIWYHHNDFFDELQVVRHRRAGMVYVPRSQRRRIAP